MSKRLGTVRRTPTGGLKQESREGKGKPKSRGQGSREQGEGKTHIAWSRGHGKRPKRVRRGAFWDLKAFGIDFEPWQVQNFIKVKNL